MTQNWSLKNFLVMKNCVESLIKQRFCYNLCLLYINVIKAISIINLHVLNIKKHFKILNNKYIIQMKNGHVKLQCFSLLTINRNIESHVAGLTADNCYLVKSRVCVPGVPDGQRSSLIQMYPVSESFIRTTICGVGLCEPVDFSNSSVSKHPLN